MPAAASDHRIKAVFKPHNEIVAATVARRLFDLGVCRVRLTNTDILPHGVVEQEIILRHIGDKFMVMFCGNIAYICTADSDTATLHIPKGSNELSNGGFSASGRSDQCIDCPLAEGQINTVIR